MSGYGMEMCHCRAGNDGTPFGRRVYMATEVPHALGAHGGPVTHCSFAETK